MLGMGLGNHPLRRGPVTPRARGSANRGPRLIGAPGSLNLLGRRVFGSAWLRDA